MNISRIKHLYGLIGCFAVLLAASDLSAQLTVSINTDEPSCNGFTDGSVTANPSGGAGPYTYLWNNGQTTQALIGIGAGVYSVTATDATNATAAASATLSQPAALGIAVTTSGIGCTSASGTMTANITGGTAPFSYLWNTGATTGTINITGPGNYFVTVTDANGCGINGFSNVPPAAEFLPVFTVIKPTCPGASDGSVMVNIFGTNPPFTWIWFNGTANQPLNNVGAGAYGITITDAKSCTHTATAVVDDNLPIILEVKVNNILCASAPNSGVVSAAVAGGALPYTYKWSNGATDQVVQNVPVGDYTVTVTDGSGCTKTASGTVTAPPPLTVTISANSPACGSGANGSATVSASGGTPPYTYAWSNGQTGATATGLAPGQYYVCTFDANKCQNDTWVVIESTNGLSVNLIVQSAECPGVATGVVTAIVNPPTGTYTYQWNQPPFTGVSQLTGLAAGTVVSVTVTDVNTGCIGTATTTVGAHNQLKIEIADEDVDCAAINNGSATATADHGTAPYTYVWTVPGVGTVNGPTLTDLAPGAYSVSVTDAKGCTAINVANIGLESDPKALIELDVLECDGENIKVQFQDVSTDAQDTIVSWDWNITWNPNGSAQSGQQTPPVLALPENQTGTAQLTVTSSNGCTASVSMPFEVDALPTVKVELPTPLITCDNQPVNVTVLGEQVYDYSWSPATGLTPNPDNQHVILDPDQSTLYVLTASNGECLDTFHINVIRVTPPNIGASSTNVVDCDSVATLSATATPPGAIIVWYQGGAVLDTNSSIEVPTIPPSVYTAVAVDQYGCKDTVDVSVSGGGVDAEIGLESPNALCAGASFKLKATNLIPTQDLTYQWSASGGLVITPPNGEVVTVSGAPAGVYYVTLTATNQFDCVAEVIDTIEINSALLAAFVNDYEECKDSADILFTDKTTGSTPVNWKWTFSDGQSSAQQNPLLSFAEGTYTVTLLVTDANGCTDTAMSSIKIDVVEQDIKEEDKLCPKEEISLNPGFNPDYTYVWTSVPPDPNLDPSAKNPKVSPKVSTVYSTTVTNGLCQETYSIEIDLLPGDTVYVPDRFNVCDDKPIKVAAEGSTATYIWSNNQTFTDIVGIDDTVTLKPKTGLYFVKNNNSQCPGLDSTRIVDASVDIAGEPLEASICEGTSLDLNVINGDLNDTLKYVWTPALDPVGNPTVTPQANTVYTAVVTNQFGCKDSLDFSISLMIIDVEAEVTGPDTICIGMSTTLQATASGDGTSYTYSWTPTGSLINFNTATPTAQPLEETDYIVTAVDNNGCIDTAQVTVFFMQTACEFPYIFVPNSFSPNGDDVNDFFIVRGVNITEMRLIVWDRWGEQVYETTDLKALGWDGTHNGKQLTPDSYAWYLEVVCGDGHKFTTKGDVTLLK